ncbi:MAG: VTC domain-containing protein [Myxococcales bacterium]|nr:VTC domain-containing protein [Myxococcales bacterium]
MNRKGPSLVIDGLEELHVVPPERLEQVALLDRDDMRFVIRAEQLPAILESLRDEYGVVLAGGRRLGRYRTVYYDTPDFQLYHEHHRGRRPRVKVRTREHVDRGLGFLEVKRKTPRGATSKFVRPRSLEQSSWGTEDAAFVREHAGVDPDVLAPVLGVSFERVTLVGKESPERVTLDLSVAFERGGTEVRIEPVVTVEVKQPKILLRSTAALAIRRADPTGLSVSKYCAGLILTGAPVKRSGFWAEVRAILRRAGLPDLPAAPPAR